ncbi:MAG: hypothetical protein IPQ13_01080 [Holophagaceae bacterium]|nr:hypothetical protein [Holophagaceae bacterium]
MNPKVIGAVVVVVGVAAWFGLKDRPSSDPAIATQQATEAALKELVPLLEDATSKAQSSTRQDQVDWNRVAENAIRAFQAKSGHSSRRNPYEAAAPAFVSGPAGTRLGTVYLDGSHATAEGVVLVTGIYRDKGSNTLHDNPQTVPVSPVWKPKAGPGNLDHMIIQGL